VSSAIGMLCDELSDSAGIQKGAELLVDGSSGSWPVYVVVYVQS
jgi:hypothetical protein